MKYEILQMLKQGARGAIVNTASAAGWSGRTGSRPTPPPSTAWSD